MAMQSRQEIVTTVFQRAAEVKRDKNLGKTAEKIQKIEANTKSREKAAAEIDKIRIKEAEKHRKGLSAKKLDRMLLKAGVGREVDPAEGIVTWNV